MQYNKLGSTGLNVSRLCLGTMTFGESPGAQMEGVGCDPKTAHAILDAAVEAGINLVDTADVYGNDGLSERVIGDWFGASNKRDEVVLATKFRMSMGEGPNANGASRYRIMRAVDESLRRLKTDRIDLYQVHMQDTSTPIDETLRALDDLVRQGKVLYIGASNYAAYRLVESLWAADKLKVPAFASLQIEYNLLTRDIEREHVPACEAFGLGILPWSPLASGMLTGKHKQGTSPDGSRLAEKKGWLKMYDRPQNWTIVDALVEVASEVEATPAAVALAWLLTKPIVNSVIFGARNVKQLQDNVAAAQLELSPEALAKLDKVSKPYSGSPYGLIKLIGGGV